MPALNVKKAALRGAKGFDVSVPVENGKSIAIFEYAGAVVRERGRSSDVVIIFNPDNVRQGENPSVLEGEQGLDFAASQWGESLALNIAS